MVAPLSQALTESTVDSAR